MEEGRRQRAASGAGGAVVGIEMILCRLALQLDSQRLLLRMGGPEMEQLVPRTATWIGMSA